MKLGEARGWIAVKPVRMILFVVALILLIIALIPTVITWAPHWLASTNGLKADQRAAEVGRVRTALLAVLAGGIAVVGAIYTARTFALNRQTYEHARETSRQSHELDEARLTTERFTRAVDQLGNTHSLDIRLGGIYALERLARESPHDHGPIVEILTAYLREHAPTCVQDGPKDRPENTPASPTSPDATPNESTDLEQHTLATDVKAVLTVLRRRNAQNDTGGLDLGQTHLTGAFLRGADLTEANLNGADLSGASLTEANLAGADLRRANLQGAWLLKAHLQRAMLDEANLQDAKLDGALYDPIWTRWPHGFDYSNSGAVPEP